MRMDSGEWKAKGDEVMEREVCTGEGGGAVREAEEGEGEVVMLQSDSEDSADDLCSAVVDS